MEKTNSNALQWNLSLGAVFGEGNGVGKVVLRKMKLLTKVLDAYHTSM